MSWKMKREFECALCRCHDYPLPIGGLPPGWHGDDSELGACYCGSCTEKMLNYGTVRLIPLDGNHDRAVCTGCGTSFNVADITIDGNEPPNRCPACHKKVSGA